MIPEDYQSQCAFYREWLEKVANKDLSLPLPQGSISNPQSSTLKQEKAFSRSKFDVSGGNLRNEDENKTLDVT